MNRETLQKLADHLRTRSAETFRMDSFAVINPDGDDVVELEPADEHPCGTVCCALGSGPEAGIPALDHESWFQYCNRAFGILCVSDEYEWLFSGRWFSRDNTPQGAASRIEWLLRDGVPFDWKRQASGEVPLVYDTSKAARTA